MSFSKGWIVLTNLHAEVINASAVEVHEIVSCWRYNMANIGVIGKLTDSNGSGIGGLYVFAYDTESIDEDIARDHRITSKMEEC